MSEAARAREVSRLEDPVCQPGCDADMYAAPYFFKYAPRVPLDLNFLASGALLPPVNLATLATLTPAEHRVVIDGCSIAPVEATGSETPLKIEEHDRLVKPTRS